MSLPEIVTYERWAAARTALLAREKRLTRERDALAAERRQLPMVEIEQPYVFDGPEGEVGLLDLFEGRRQLIVQHFMFRPEWEDGCPSCTAAADELSQGLFDHLHARDTSFAAIARAPLERIERYKAERGWTFPFYSSYGSDFNHDFGVTVDDAVAPAAYNFRTRAEHEAAGTGYYFDAEQPIEQPGTSCFLRVGERIFHTNSTYGRGGEQTGGSYYWLDLTALGRQEAWEEPRGRVESAHAAIPDFAS